MQMFLTTRVFFVTERDPALTPTDRPALDVTAIKTVLVEATSMVEGLRLVLEREDATEDSKAIVRIRMLQTMVGVVVEKGLETLSTTVLGVAGNPSGRGFHVGGEKDCQPAVGGAQTTGPGQARAD